MKMGSEGDRLLWLDVETAGVDEGYESVLLEIGWIFTDWNIEPDWSLLKHYPIIRKPDIPIERVFAPHFDNGLVQETANVEGTHARHVSDVIDELHDDIDSIADEGHRIMLAGNSVGFDRNAVSSNDPSVFDRLHYHIIDISVLNEVFDAWNNPKFRDVPDKDTDHRVSTCLHGSIAQARAYRDIIRSLA
jgi:oligoribonuclease (3'-5' exoribonuclease)